MRPSRDDDFTEPVQVQLRFLCDRDSCSHRVSTGYCCVGDPQLTWQHVQGRLHLFECRSYDRRK